MDIISFFGMASVGVLVIATMFFLAHYENSDKYK